MPVARRRFPSTVDRFGGVMGLVRVHRKVANRVQRESLLVCETPAIPAS